MRICGATSAFVVAFTVLYLIVTVHGMTEMFVSFKRCRVVAARSIFKKSKNAKLSKPGAKAASDSEETS